MGAFRVRPSFLTANGPCFRPVADGVPLTAGGGTRWPGCASGPLCGSMSASRRECTGSLEGGRAPGAASLADLPVEPVSVGGEGRGPGVSGAFPAPRHQSHTPCPLDDSLEDSPPVWYSPRTFEHDKSRCRGWRGFTGQSFGRAEHEIHHECGPAGLVRGAEPCPGVTVEVLVERQQVVPVRVLLEEALPAEHRPTAVRVVEE